MHDGQDVRRIRSLIWISVTASPFGQPPSPQGKNRLLVAASEGEQIMEHDDKQLRKSVSSALEWAPDVSSAHIGVMAKNGVVTLTGHVVRYAEKVAAERVASRVKGVRAIAEEIEVRWPSEINTDDEAIAEKAVNILSWDTMLPSGRIGVRVEHGWVSLTGEVDWQYQRTLAAQDMHRLTGVVGISNQIQLAKTVQPTDMKLRARHKISASTIKCILLISLTNQ